MTEERWDELLELQERFDLRQRALARAFRLTPLQGEGYVLRSGGQARKKPYASPRSLRHYLERVVKGSGLKATWNTLRHSRASWWIQDGRPIAKVASWLGHSVETCLRHYAGLLQGYDPDCERKAA